MVAAILNKKVYMLAIRMTISIIKVVSGKNGNHWILMEILVCVYILERYN